MIIFVHILSALGSLATGSWAYFRPSPKLLRMTSALTATTFLSGTYLVLNRHLNILSVCLSGLLYLSAITGLLILARRRLSKSYVR